MVLPVKPGIEGLSGSSKRRPFAVLLNKKEERMIQARIWKQEVENGSGKPSEP